MRKMFIYIIMIMLIVPFLAINVKANPALSFEGKASVVGYRDVGKPFSWHFIKNCNISLNFTKWTILKGSLFCWFSLRNGELSIYNSESNYNYVDGTRIRGFLIFPDGIWTIWGV